MIKKLKAHTLNSGASFNFNGKVLVARLGWNPCTKSSMKVYLANGKKIESSGSVVGLV